MKKIMNAKRISSLLTVFVILFSFMAIPASASSVSEAKNSVVAVINANGTSYGTGFAIGEVGKPVRYIVTNNHVVEGQYNTTATVAFDLASNEMMSANIYLYNVEKDVAILELPKATEQRQAMILCPKKKVDIDDTFAALGYPDGQITDWPRYNTSDITVTKGGIKKTDRVAGQDVYMLDIAITNGNSGGPLVNSDGDVIGINTFGLSGENYAITIDEIIRLIDKEEISVTIRGTINWFIIAAVFVLLVIIALVVILIVRRKSDNNDGYTGTNYTVPLDNGANQTSQQAPVQERPTARVIALGGTLNGKRFSVAGTVKVGRDSSQCAIAFPVNTQGVSGVHCEIGFSGSVLYVKDLNSSYGTFTVDGNRLAPNTPQILKSGDKFYLASPENTFEVRF